MQIGNDVVFMYTVFPIILNYAILLFETMYIALLFSGVAYSAYAVNKGTDKFLPCIVYPISLIFLKHTLNLIVSSLIDSYIDVTFDLPVTLMLMFVDLFMALIVWIIADRKSKHHLVRYKKILKASKYLATAEYENAEEIYPFKGFFNLKNPILLSIFVGTLVATSLMLIQRAYADIFVLGVPGSLLEIGEMIIAYMLDIILAFAGYATSYFAVSYMFLREEKISKK